MKTVTHPISKLLVEIVTGMCSHPEALEYHEYQHPGNKVDLVFWPHGADMGLVIGAHGRQSSATTAIGTWAGRRQGIAFHVKFEESYRGEKEPRQAFVHNPGFNRDEFDRLFREVCRLLFDTPPAFEYQDLGEVLKVVMDIGPEFKPVEVALSDMFYPWGIRKGKKIKIKSRPEF